LREQAKKAKASKSVIKRKVTSYKNRGFAFSQEAGNDKLLTEKLSTRIGQALLRNITAAAKIEF